MRLMTNRDLAKIMIMRPSRTHGFAIPMMQLWGFCLVFREAARDLRYLVITCY